MLIAWSYCIEKNPRVVERVETRGCISFVSHKVRCWGLASPLQTLPLSWGRFLPLWRLAPRAGCTEAWSTREARSLQVFLERRACPRTWTFRSEQDGALPLWNLYSGERLDNRQNGGDRVIQRKMGWCEGLEAQGGAALWACECRPE